MKIIVKLFCQVVLLSYFIFYSRSRPASAVAEVNEGNATNSAMSLVESENKSRLVRYFFFVDDIQQNDKLQNCIARVSCKLRLIYWLNYNVVYCYVVCCI